MLRKSHNLSYAPPSRSIYLTLIALLTLLSVLIPTTPTSTCSPNTNGCQTCNPSNTSQCDTCLQQYTLTPTTKQCIYCNITNCLKCSAISFCQQCSGNQMVPSLDGSTCLKNCLIPNCQSCSSTQPYGCLSCQSGYQLTSYGCITCNTPNCLTCWNTNLCSICQPGYSLYEGQCSLCLYPLQSFQTYQCSYCSYPYSSYPNYQNQCFPCYQPNCLICPQTNPASCSVCMTQYSVNSEGVCELTCTDPNCYSCYASDGYPEYCSECYPGFVLNNYTCLACQNQPICQQCDETNQSICTQCDTGFYLPVNGTQCKPCDIAGYCVKCNQDGVCQSVTSGQGYTAIEIINTNGDAEVLMAMCAQGCLNCVDTNPGVCYECIYGMYLTQDGVCLPCSGDCRTCQLNAPTICLSCAEYSWLNTTDDTCQRCNSNCKTCTGINLLSNCTSCSSGYLSPSGNNDNTFTCKPCPSNCRQCQSATKCTQCQPGMTPVLQSNISETVCTFCENNCAFCAFNTPGVCLFCLTGYMLDQNSGLCVQCAENCESCDASGCYACKTGYFFTVDLKCVPDCVAPCAECSTTNPEECTACVAGYDLNQTSNKCEASTTCPEGGCVVCPFGYVLSQTQCLECNPPSTSSPCQRCNPYNLTQCTSCHKGYYLQTSSSTCVQCDSSCSQCINSNGCTICASTYVQIPYPEAISSSLSSSATNPTKQSFNIQCLKCQSPCLECQFGENICTSCVSGYFYSTNKLTCFQCDIDNCQQCQNEDNSCSLCADGYLPSADSGKECLNCSSIANCAVCQNKTACAECKTSFNLNSDGSQCIVSDCPSILNCQQCANSTTCKTCQSNYTLASNGTSCIECQIQNCVACDNYVNTCTQCSNTTSLSLNTNLLSTQCIPCNITFCSVCLTENYCAICQTNLQVNYTSGLCQCQQNYTLYNQNECVACPLDGCLTCSQPSNCSECQPGYQLINLSQSNNYTGVCIECDIENCLKCSSNQYCSQCAIGYHISPNGDTCLICNVIGCAYCEGNGDTCAVCQSGYKLSFTNQNCVKCQNDNCLRCETNNLCAECEPGYYIAANNICQPCLYPCQQCTSNGQCGTCQFPPFSKFPSQSNLSHCYECSVLNCLVCDEDTPEVCFECISGLNFNSTTGTCQLACQQIDHCAECTEETNTTTNVTTQKCVECMEGFYYEYESNSCRSCTYSICLECFTANSGFITCSKCRQGFYLSTSYTCQPCPYFCLECNNYGTCQGLDVNYQVGNVMVTIEKSGSGTSSSVTQSIALCSQGCKTCSNMNPQICYECLEGRYLTQQTNVCYSCPQGCKTCLSTNTQDCLSCFNNAFLTSNHQCLICNQTSGCETCLQDNLSYCVTCPDGSFLFNSTGTMICISQCPDQCVGCQDRGSCTQCSLGYTLIANGYGYSCMPCASSCQVCATGRPDICLSCGEGFYLNAQSQCTRCLDNCDYCDILGCITCQSGFYLSDLGTCYPICEFPCSECTSTNAQECTNCYVGYKLDSNTSTCVEDLECNSGYGECEYCPVGYVLYEQECVKCTVENCGWCKMNESSSSSSNQCLICINGYYLQTSSNCASCPSQCSTCLGPNQCTSCSAGYLPNPNSPNQNSDNISCTACIFPCQACHNHAYQCLTCVQNYTFNGWQCIKKFNWEFTLLLDTSYDNFYSNYYTFLTSILQNLALTTIKEISITKIFNGSVMVSGYLSPNVESDTQDSALFNEKFQKFITQNTIAGMTIIEANSTINGGQAGTVKPEPTSNTGLIVGLSIAGVFLVVIGVFAIYYVIHRRKRNSQGMQRLTEEGGYGNRTSSDGDRSTYRKNQFGKEKGMEFELEPQPQMGGYYREDGNGNENVSGNRNTVPVRNQPYDQEPVAINRSSLQSSSSSNRKSMN